jgi:hypothetical protein
MWYTQVVPIYDWTKLNKRDWSKSNIISLAAPQSVGGSSGGRRRWQFSARRAAERTGQIAAVEGRVEEDEKGDRPRQHGEAQRAAAEREGRQQCRGRQQQRAVADGGAAAQRAA